MERLDYRTYRPLRKSPVYPTDLPYVGSKVTILGWRPVWVRTGPDMGKPYDGDLYFLIWMARVKELNRIVGEKDFSEVPSPDRW